MRLIHKILTYAISLTTIIGTLYLTRIPVAAHVNVNSLPLSEIREFTPKEYLYAHAGEWATTLDRLIQCESGWKPEAKSSSSSATGLAQFITGTWVSTRTAMGRDPDPTLRTDPTEMIDTTLYLWNYGRGQSHWDASRSCWYDEYRRSFDASSSD